MRKYILILILFATHNTSYTQEVKIGILKYNGGGDWYSNPTSIPNLIEFCNANLKTTISNDVPSVNIASSELFGFPIVHLTGHGNIILSPVETENLRKYLSSGGFMHISDNYGLDKYIRREMKRVFPELDFMELPYSHPIYHQTYSFNEIGRAHV